MSQSRPPQSEGMLVVETILPVVSGRGAQRLEILCDLSLDRRARYPERVLGTHVTDCRLDEVSLVTDAFGQRRIRVTGQVHVSAWCLGREETFVLGDVVAFQRDIDLPASDGGEYRNERVTAYLVGEPVTGPGAIIKEGEELFVRVPVFIQVEGEVVGERRVYAYAQTSPPAVSPQVPVSSSDDDPDYE